MIYSVVFPYLLKMQEENYPLFVFVGLLPWIYFTSSVQISTTSIVGNGNLIKKIYFPRMVIPISISATGLVNFLFGLAIAFPALLFAGITPSPCMLFLPVIMAAQFLFTTGFCLMLSAAYVFFRDLEHIVSIVTTAWFYLTPIVYSLKIFPDHVQSVLMLNPMTQFTLSYRNVLMYGEMPSAAGFSATALLSAGIFLLGAFIFSKLQKTFAEEL